MEKLVLGSLLGALAMFVWDAVFWMSPIPYTSFGRLSDDAAAGKKLLEIFPESGTYAVPGTYNDPKVIESLMQTGPVVTVHFRREGGAMMSPGMFASGYLHEFVCVLLMGLLLRMALPNLAKYGCRVCFVTLAGTVGAFFGNFANPIWMFHPWGYYLFNAGYAIVAWLLAGLILAKFVKPESPAPAA